VVFLCLWFVVVFVCGLLLFFVSGFSLFVVFFIVWLLPPHAGWLFFVYCLVFFVPVRGVFVFCLDTPVSYGIV